MKQLLSLILALSLSACNSGLASGTAKPTPTVTVTVTPSPSILISPSPSPSPVIVTIPSPYPTPVVVISPSPVPCSCSCPSPTPSSSPTPQVSPSPSPSPSPSVSPSVVQFADTAQKPFPGVTINWMPSASLAGSRGEVVTALMKTTATSCSNLSTITGGAATEAYFKLGTFTTTAPSYVGAPVGAQYDPMTPATQICPGDLVWVDVSILPDTAPGKYLIQIGGALVPLKVWKMAMPVKPNHPIYMEITGVALLAGHRLDPNSNVQVQASLTQKYLDMARAHRIEPYKQNVTDLSATSGIDQWSTYGGSFRQLELTGNLAPAMLNNPSYSAAQLTSSLLGYYDQVSGQFPGSWAYVMDEPNTSALLSEAIARAKLYRQSAPNTKTMVTAEWSAALDPYVDYFCPHDLFFNQPGHVAASAYSSKPFWLYGSCMNHGSCGDGASSSVGVLPGPPDLLIDLPMVHPRAYAWVNATLGAKASLYYAMVEGYLHYGLALDTWANQYVFSGNGDGTLFYPDRANGVPIASIRLKAIRQSSFDLEYVALARAAGISFSNPVVDALHWSKAYGDYEAVRLQLGEALNAL